MLKFFRRIRYNLLSDNKFSKYLKYALGEILLVVIGILIALQINNWNEENKLKKQEIQIYKELKNDLVQTKKDIEETIKKHKRISKLSQELIFDIQNQVEYSSDIYIRFINSNRDIQIIPKTSAYENLKNVGLNILSNDSLRIDITNLYQLVLGRFDDELGLNTSGENIKRLLFPYQEKYIYAQPDKSVTMKFEYADSIVIPQLIIKEYDQFLSDNDLLKDLQLTLFTRKRKIDSEIKTVLSIDDMITRIEDELDSLNK